MKILCDNYIIPLDRYIQMDSDTDFESNLNNPYRDDPEWEPWHAQAVDVHGGPDEDSSSDSDEGDALGGDFTLPETCVCQCCRFVSNSDLRLDF
jgi:hypothetical protein